MEWLGLHIEISSGLRDEKPLGFSNLLPSPVNLFQRGEKGLVSKLVMKLIISPGVQITECDMDSTWIFHHSVTKSTLTHTYLFSENWTTYSRGEIRRFPKGSPYLNVCVKSSFIIITCWALENNVIKMFKAVKSAPKLVIFVSYLSSNILLSIDEFFFNEL